MDTEIDKDLLRIKGHFVEKYGEDMDPWEARFHYEAKENFKLLENQLRVSISEINSARNQIKGQIRSVHFHDWKEAFAYGFSKYLLFGISALILVIFPIYFYQKTKKVQAVNDFYDRFKNTLLYQNLISNGDITPKKGINYLILKPGQGNELTIGEDYIFDNANKRVLVPLGKIQ
jgi:hypothetical protein